MIRYFLSYHTEPHCRNPFTDNSQLHRYQKSCRKFIGKYIKILAFIVAFTGALIGLLFVIYLLMLIHTIIHEAGHLVFGFLTGYRFNSFRILSLMWIKQDGKLRFKRHSIAGTAGQCLMSPPDMTDERIPFVLYNLGGAFMNMIVGLLSLGLFFLFPDVSFFSIIMLFFAVNGFMAAIRNGVPMQRGMVNNDGYNTYELTRSPQALRSFWIQLKANEQLANGVRIKDMPDEWFILPTDEAMQNSMIATIGAFACNRLMDMKQFEEADKLMAHILEINSAISNLYRNSLICDRIYLELITENRREILDGMLATVSEKFIKSSKNFPSVLRTSYTYALFYEKDTQKANAIKARFEKLARLYPYPCDIQTERELIEIAKNRARQQGLFTETPNSGNKKRESIWKKA